jgi:hypothetical protein
MVYFKYGITMITLLGLDSKLQLSLALSVAYKLRRSNTSKVIFYHNYSGVAVKTQQQIAERNELGRSGND